VARYGPAWVISQQNDPDRFQRDAFPYRKANQTLDFKPQECQSEGDGEDTDIVSNAFCDQL
jgi:hypothetical protein